MEWKSEGAEPVAVVYASISVLNLMRAATGSQCREIFERCDGPFLVR